VDELAAGAGVAVGVVAAGRVAEAEEAGTVKGASVSTAFLSLDWQPARPTAKTKARVLGRVFMMEQGKGWEIN
jgi:hypothetical protein